MENKKTWLDSLYNHPRRDEILKAYIMSYLGDEELKIEDVVMSKYKDEDVIDVTYLTNYYETPFRYYDKSDKPLKIHLLIGEYFKKEKAINRVTLGEVNLKKFKEYSKSQLVVVLNESPVYMFNEISSLADGKNAQYLIKILEELNEGVVINNETFREMLIRKTKPIMDEMLKKDPTKKDHYEKWYDSYINWKYISLEKFLKLDGLFDKSPIK